MSIPFPTRRVVAGHDEHGRALVLSDTEQISQPMTGMKGVYAAPIWITGDGLPTNDNNTNEDGAKRVINSPANKDLVHPAGTNFRTTELAPLAASVMHRTTSLDYNVLVSGELVLILDDGSEINLKNPGDCVILKGNYHAWKNPSSTNSTRWVTVLMAAEPCVIDGKPLEPSFLRSATA